MSTTSGKILSVLLVAAAVGAAIGWYAASLSQSSASGDRSSAGQGPLPPDQQTLEYKAASIDAGQLLPANDRSVKRMGQLIDLTARTYATDPVRAVDMAAKASELSKSSAATSFSIADALEAALFLCRDRCATSDLASHLAFYSATRSPDQTHFQTLRGLILLDNAARRMR